MVRLFIISILIICSLGVNAQEIPAVIAEKLLDLPGTYVGKLPCADCSGIESSLTLQCDSLCHGGKYMLIDKYQNTKNGDQTNKIKGNWGLVKYTAVKKNEVIIISLNVEDTAKMIFYEVTKKGDLMPVNKSFQKIEATTDIELKRLAE